MRPVRNACSSRRRSQVDQYMPPAMRGSGAPRWTTMSTEAPRTLAKPQPVGRGRDRTCEALGSPEPKTPVTGDHCTLRLRSPGTRQRALPTPAGSHPNRFPGCQSEPRVSAPTRHRGARSFRSDPAMQSGRYWASRSAGTSSLRRRRLRFPRCCFLRRLRRFCRGL
jgi:hypothetical protein